MKIVPFRLSNPYGKTPEGFAPTARSEDEGPGMGIQDRDYYRDDTRWHNPFARSKATIGLIALYVVMFVVQVVSRDEAVAQHLPSQKGAVTDALELNADRVFSGEVWRIVSHALIHETAYPLSLIITCVFLGWLGHMVEDIYGWKEYLSFFMLTTVLGGLAFVGSAAMAGTPAPLQGPSGAVTAILVLFALHYPNRTIPVFFLPVPVWLIVIGHAAMDVLAISAANSNLPRVSTHIACACFAFIYHAFTLRALNWLPNRESRRLARRTPKPRISRETRQPEPAAAPSRVLNEAVASPIGPTVDEHLEAKLDDVLAKVQRFGRESLTDGEREILLKASEIYKKRRQSS